MFAGFLFVSVLSVQAHGWIHIARDGETLEQLANYYYGDPKKSIIIRAANGFMHPDDGSVLQGERVEILRILKIFHTTWLNQVSPF